MKTSDIQPGEANVIEVFASGDLVVNGWDESWIQASADDQLDEARPGSGAEAVRLAFGGDGRLRVPAGLTTRILQARGDARIRDLNGSLETVEVSGDLRVDEIRGEVRVGSVAGDVTIRRVDGPVFVENAASDLQASQINGSFSCDRVGSDLKVETVNGPVSVTNRVGADLAMAGVNGPATVANVSGDFDLVDCQIAQIDSVAGDLTAKDLRGELHAHQVGGDAQIQSCAGPVRLDAVGGDLKAASLPGGITAPAVGGRIRLSTGFAPGQTYELGAGGAVTILVAGDPSTISATFELRRNDHQDVVVAIPLEDVAVEPGYLRGRIGAGEATVRVTTGSSLRVGTSGETGSGFEGFFEGLFDDIGESIRGAFSGFAWAGADRSAEERIEQFARRTEDKAQRIAERAERSAQRAAERAQHQAERAARHAERFAGKWNWRWSGPPVPPSRFWPTPPAPPAPPAPPPARRASEEERLTILNMLAAGTITAEDAAKLLQALGS
jgi:hypothetical protein